MSLVPNNEERRNDTLDFISDGMKEIIDMPNEQGIMEKQIMFNPEIAWFKGHVINKPFGRLALQLKNFQRLGIECHKYMSPARAADMASSISLIVDGYKRSIDAKSSETFKDKNNTQSSLIHIINKNKVEKQYTVKGEAAKGILAGLMGRQGQAETDDS